MSKSKNNTTSRHPPTVTIESGSENLESMRRLQALKDKIGKEWEKEKQERFDTESKDPIVPISLMTNDTDGSPSAQGKFGKKSHSRRAQQERHQLLSKDAKEKIHQMKLPEKWMNRDLEARLEQKAQEMQDLRQKNVMYRDMITLRQESNTRREEAVEKEIEKLRGITDSICVRSKTIDESMAELRQMNKQIQDGTAQLKETMERQAEADLLGLIRTYRVRMREVKQQIQEQQTVNYEGAKAWIDRHDVLVEDRDTAKANLEALQAHNQMLITQNEELKVMTKHQAEQRNTLTAKIAVVKRENKRLEEQVSRLENQLVETTKTVSVQPNPVKHIRTARASTAPGGVSREGTARTIAGNRSVFIDKRQTAALAKVRKQLETMRKQLREVRTNHVELLQERTELEVFMRQCIEDVRRDMYRFTVVSTIPRTISGDKVEEEKSILQEYGAKEKKVLIDILNSKLKVLSLLHTKMFPQKSLASSDVLGDFIPQEPGQEEDHPQELVASRTSTDEVAELDMDKLWSRWKQWSSGLKHK